MTSSELLEKIDVLLTALDDDRYLLQTLKLLSESSYVTAAAVGTYLGMGTPNDLHNYNEKSKNDLNNTVEKRFKDIEPFTLASEITSLETRLNDFASSLKGGDIFIGVYRDAIEKFKTEYRKFNRDKKLPETVVMLHAASNLYSSLISHRAMLIIVRDNLRDAEPEKDGKARITIVIESELTFLEFSKKASAISDAYSTIASLLKVNAHEQPLTIVKVESGCAWFDLLGNPAVVAVLSSVATATAVYLISRFTRDGQLAAVPRNIEAAEKVLGLSDRLSEHGYDMSQAEENVKNAVVKISQNMNDLLEGEPVVRINGGRHSVGVALERKLLEARGQKMLDHLQGNG